MPFKVPEPSYNLIPEGIYEVILKDGGYMDATEGGTTYLNIPMVVRNDVEQKYKNMFIWDAVWTSSTQKHIDFKTGAISAALEISPGTEFESIEQWGEFLKGKVLRVAVKHEEYQGKMQVKINGYYKTECPDVKRVFKSKSIAVVPSPENFEEIPIPDDDDGEFPF